MAERGARADEGYQAWLERLDVPLEDTANIDRLRSALGRIFEEQEMFEPTPAQVDSLWDAVTARFQWAEVGIRPFTQGGSIGSRLRFGISGVRGSFGLERARAFYKERTGRAAPF